MIIHIKISRQIFSISMKVLNYIAHLIQMISEKKRIVQTSAETQCVVTNHTKQVDYFL
jgi:hypothetical protein